MLAAQEPNLIDTLWKLAVIAILAPLWGPVLKALYADFDGALREEGGLFGRTPTPDELETLRLEGKLYQSPLSHEPFEAGPTRGAGPETRRSGGRGAGPRGGSPEPRRRTPRGRSSNESRGFLDR